ncbi:hypothetical protein Glove_54g3 [Diversispora epigaea]|uniref:Protein kinase domain-containing protein n=1 Tax=Diversispora epigaea TaxID=1348612 RepID=A0A397JCS8_9GLOM|nr:hypothetical protein Glove_54g3 [Diversispora epigaea]
MTLTSLVASVIYAPMSILSMNSELGGNVEIDKVIQESQKKNGYDGYKLQWLPYDNFQNIEHIANGGYGSVYSAILKNGTKYWWNFNNQDWEYDYVGKKVALKEINDSRHDISKFLQEVKNLMITADNWLFVTKCIGISKNLSSQNYIIVMELHVHRDLHSGNILTKNNTNSNASITDLGLCSLANDLILSSDNKSNKIYGSIPYIPPEVLRGNEFTKKGDIYSFGGIMYEMATGKQPFYDRAHDTRLIIDICNGMRPKIPDIVLDWIPKWYLDLMYQCWSDNVLQQFIISDENREKAIKSLKQESSLSSSISHSQSCYISRSIHTLHGLYNSLEDIISGKFQDPNLLIPNEPTTSSVSTYDIDPKESQECIDWDKEIQNQAKKRSFFNISTLDCDFKESKECING